MKNEQGDFSMWRAVSWIIFRRIIISHELIKTRKKIIKMAFGKYSLPLNEKELENLFQDPSNWWLDLTPEKIKLVRWFCDALLGDDDFCKQICCESACSSDDYFQIVEKCRNTFDKIYRWSFMMSLRKSIFNHNAQSFNGEFTDDFVGKYIESYNDSFFLMNSGRADND